MAPLGVIATRHLMVYELLKLEYIHTLCSTVGGCSTLISVHSIIQRQLG